MKSKRAPRTAADYAPIKSVLESGDVERDAQHVLLNQTKPLRRHELWRLGHIHGEEHQAAVQKRVLEIWNETQGAPELEKAA